LLSIILYFIISLNFFVFFGYRYFKIKTIQKIIENLKNMSKENIIVNYKKNNNKKKKNTNIFHINRIKIDKMIKDINNVKQPPKRKTQSKSTKSMIDISNNSKRSLNLYKLKKDYTISNFKLDLTSEIKNLSHKNLIHISNSKNPKLISQNKQFLNYNDYELNSLPYEKALNIDKRTYCKYYISLLRTKHLIIFTFFTHDDYNSKTIKICLFFFSFALYFTVNTLFFNESKIHKIYENEGEYMLIYRIPLILYSFLISSILTIIINYFSLSQKSILEIKNERYMEKIEYKIPVIFKCLTIKFSIFFELSFIFLIFFWYYLSCFCAVYKNTQLFLIKDAIFCFILSLFYPFLINLLPGILRIPSLSNRNRRIMYKFSKIIELL